MEDRVVAIKNLAWRFAERSGAQIVQFIVSIILARILAPEIYGTVAIAIIIAQILQVFVDSGLATALIQKKDADDLDFATVFLFNIAWCAVLYVLIYLVAPLIAAFFKNASLVALIRVLSLTLIISAVKNVQQAYISKTLQFKKFFWGTLGGTILSAFAGIYVAVKGGGAWAIVVQKLVNLFVDTLIIWIIVDWKPKLMFSFQRLKGLFVYGWKLLISALIDRIYENLWQMVIGKFYTEADLAYYNQGKQFPNIIVNNVNTSIDSVLLPLLAKEQDDTGRLKSKTQRAIKVSTYIMAPAMVGLMAIADSLVCIILTSKWLPCVPYLRIFCFSSLFYPIHTANLNAMKAIGRSDVFLKLEILKKAIGFIMLIFTIKKGINMIAYSVIVLTLISQILNAWPNKKLLGYGYFEQVRDIASTITLSGLMGIMVLVVGMIDLPLVIKVIVQVCVGVIVYILGSFWTKNDTFIYILNMVKQIKKH